MGRVKIFCLTSGHQDLPNLLLQEFSVSPRSCTDISEEDNKRLVLGNVPTQSTEKDITKFLSPYDIWVNPDARHYRCRTPERDYCNLTITMVSKLAAFFVFMKRDGRNMLVDNSLVQIHIKMYGYSAQTEVDTDISDLKTLLAEQTPHSPASSENLEKVSQMQPKRPLYKPEDVVRRFPIPFTRVLIMLKNLPPDTTKEDVVSILGKHTANPPFQIFLQFNNADSLDAHVSCPSISLAQMTVDNVRTFKIGSYTK